MGSSGSTRWLFHWKKTLVEDCHKMTIYSLKPYLKLGFLGTMTWKRGERRTGSITYQVDGIGMPDAIRLQYSINDSRAGEKVELDYLVHLQTTQTVWGSLRYWFTCPLSTRGQPCVRRVGALYLPPGEHYFGCRHCYKLTYQSAQESKRWDSFYASMAIMMQQTGREITPEDIKFMFAEEKGNPPEGYYQRLLGDRWLDFPDPYAKYLTADDLCRQAGLTSFDLSRLDSARLLLPDHDGIYRPKLAGWGRKLAYLLTQGWQLDEIKAWAKGRWSTPDPRQWPPERDCWLG